MAQKIDMVRLRKDLLSTPDFVHLISPGPWAGLVAPWYHTIPITIKAGKAEYNIEEDSAVEDDFVVGLWVTRRKDANHRDDKGNLLANDRVFNSAYLTLNDARDQMTKGKNIPFTLIENVNVGEGKPLTMFMPAAKMSKSTVTIGDNAGMVADEVLLLTVAFFPMPQLQSF